MRWTAAMRLIGAIVGMLFGGALLGFVGGYVGLRAGEHYEDIDPSEWSDSVITGMVVGAFVGGTAGGWLGFRFTARREPD